MVGKMVKVTIGKVELVWHMVEWIFQLVNEPRAKIPPSLDALLVQPLYPSRLAAKLYHNLVEMSEQLDCVLRMVICPDSYSIANVM